MKIKHIFYTLFAILGNPFVILLSYLLTYGLFDAKTTVSTNTTQINILIFYGLMFVFFLVRLWLYQLVALGKIDFRLQNIDFFAQFVDTQKWFGLGLFNLYLYSIPVEGNIMGFINLPVSLISILVLNILTVILLIRMARRF